MSCIIISGIIGFGLGFIIALKVYPKLIVRGLASNPDRRKELLVAIINLDKNTSK